MPAMPSRPSSRSDEGQGHHGAHRRLSGGGRCRSPAPVEAATAPADPALSSFVGEELAEIERPELTSARIIVSGGRAMQSRENFAKYIEPVADKLGAAVGASRAAVDARLCAQRLAGRSDRQGGRA